MASNDNIRIFGKPWVHARKRTAVGQATALPLCGRTLGAQGLLGVVHSPESVTCPECLELIGERIVADAPKNGGALTYATVDNGQNVVGLGTSGPITAAAWVRSETDTDSARLVMTLDVHGHFTLTIEQVDGETRVQIHEGYLWTDGGEVSLEEALERG